MVMAKAQANLPKAKVKSMQLERKGFKHLLSLSAAGVGAVDTVNLDVRDPFPEIVRMGQQLDQTIQQHLLAKWSLLLNCKLQVRFRSTKQRLKNL
jgi:hypothetical protein